MKKSIICLIVAAGMVASCDPIKEEKDFEIYTVTSSEIENAVSITQADANGNAAADGNYFTYTTNPAMDVAIYNFYADGSENLLAHGKSGSFVIKPKRGSDPNQTFYIRVVGSDNNPIEISKTYNVYVQQELDPEIRLIASDAYGSKIWKWDPSINGVVWGNMGYCGGSGADVALVGNGQWWGVVAESETEAGSGNGFLQQLQHTHDGAYHGDGDVNNSYMIFTDENIATTYDANGGVIRNDTYKVENYNPDGEWKVGDLVTTAILWPYEINSGGNVPGRYEICYLSADKMCLVYPDGGDFGSLGGWGEATFWRFCSNSDIEGLAIGYGKSASKDWTWNTEAIDGVVWGNMGYCGGAGANAVATGKWWGVTSEAEFMGQLNHTNDGNAHGDESMDAYFTLSNEGTITRHAGDGSVINSGTFEIDITVANEWKVANLNTTAGTILFPYEINSGGNMPTTFEILDLTGSKMTLCYPDGGAFDGLGGWGEATFWQFKAK